MNDKILWQKVLDNISTVVNPLSFRTWFESIDFIDIKDNNVRLVVPVILYKHHLEQNYNDIILDRLLLYKGIIAENYVATQLLVNKHPLIYWESRKSGGSGFYFI